MRFIHIADVHLGAEPDAGSAYSDVRPGELWETFEEVVQICEEEQTDLLLIAGDLFHRQPLLRELKEVNYLFSALTHTKVVLIAGNHDYIAANSYYRTFSWNENVYPLFGQESEYVRFEDLDTAVYGFSYYFREIRDAKYDMLRASGLAGTEILLAHGGDEKHIPIRKSTLEQSGFDYIALGHIHRQQEMIPNYAVYAGSLEPTDKNDTGHHGYIRGEIRKGIVKTVFVPLAKREYLHLALKVTPEMTVRGLRTWMRQIIEERGKENFYLFTLKGFRDADVNFSQEELLVGGNVLEVFDDTKIAYDMSRIRRDNQDNLIGRYIGMFDGCEEGSIEEMALYEGVQALLETR